MRRPLAGTLLTLGAAAAVLNPLRNFPLDDDWCYFIEARRLLHEHVLRLLDSAPSTQVAHVAWGALVGSVFGLSHGALRVSTLCLAAVALATFARLAGGKDDRVATSPVFLLMANPLFFVLSFTYMTDVPFLAWSLIAAALYLEADAKGRDALLLAGSAAASWAYLIRQHGMLLPLAALAFLSLRGRLTARRAALAALLPALTVLAHRYWFLRVHGVTWSGEVYLRRGTLLHLSHPLRFAWDFYTRAAGLALELGLFSLPSILALNLGGEARRPGAKALLALLAGILPFLLVGGGFPYQAHVLWARGLGACSLSGAEFKAAGLLGSPWFLSAMTVLSIASLAGWLARGRELRGAAEEPAVQFLALAGALMVGASFLGEQYFDRYGLPLLPGALLLAARAASVRPSGRRWPAAVAGVLFLLWSIAGTWDYLNWSEARWRAGTAAADAGIPADRLFNGLEWTALNVYERNMSALKARKPLAEIGEWEWLTGQDFVAETSFSPRPPDGERRILDVPYRTPLSLETRRVYVYARTPRRP